MKKIFITICKIILGLLLTITIIYSLPNDIDELFYVKAMTHHILTEIRDTIIVGVNKNKNSKALNEYLKEYYGDVIYNVVEIKENHRYGSEMVYYIKMPFMDNMFYVFINNGDITQVNFHDKVFYDPKFQHLYSEWIKKQVGIDDDNIEINFKEAVKGSRWVGEKPYIEFSNINSIDDLEEDICKNTHNLYVYNVEISNFNSPSVEDVLTIVKRYERLLKPYAFSDGDNVLWFGVKLNDSINDKDDPYRYGILFDYNNNEKKYYKYYEKRPIENNKSAYIEFD